MSKKIGLILSFCLIPLFSNYSDLRFPDGYLDVARGVVQGYTGFQKFAVNPDISTSTETVWSYGGLYTYLTTDTTFMVTSTDVDDSTGDTGARGITIYGLDSNYNEINETVLLMGTDSVATTKEYLRIFRVIVDSAGSTGSNEGAITLSRQGVVYANISVGANQTLMGIYTVPAGKTAYIFYGKASSTSGKSVTFDFLIRPQGGVFQLKHRFYLYQNTYDFTFDIPLRVPEKTDMDVRAISSASGTGVSAVWNMIIIDNQ